MFLINFAFPLLLLVSTFAFAAPTGKDLQPKTEHHDLDATFSSGPASGLPTVPPTEIKESSTAQPSSETNDVMDSADRPFEKLSEEFYRHLTPQGIVATKKELSELRQLQFYNTDERMVQLLNSYFVNKYDAKGPEIRPILQEFKFMDLDNLDEPIKKLSELLSISDTQVMRDILTVWGQLVVEALDKIQYRVNDDKMEQLLEERFSERVHEAPNRETIHNFRAGSSLDEGDKNLVKYMKTEYNMDEITTQLLINGCRVEAFDENCEKLVTYSDDEEMDQRIEKLLNTKAAAEKEGEVAEAITDAISRARDEIKENLDAAGLAAYNDDQKMSIFLANILKNPTVGDTVKEARWQLTVDLAIRFQKRRALRKLIRSRGSYSVAAMLASLLENQSSKL